MNKDPKPRIKVVIKGIPGYVEFGDWPSLRGKWASHTGFQSGAGQQQMPLIPDNAEAIALAAYERQSAYPFVVGAEHREHGWKDVDTDFKGRVVVRLPSWHEGRVAAILEDVGMRLVDPVNTRYGFLDPVDVADVRKALTPILAKGTRFADEAVLAERLRKSALPVFLKQSQMSLF